MKGITLLIFILLLVAQSQLSFSQHMGGKMRGMNKKQAFMPALSINFNLLNVALYGPIVQMEVKLVEKSFLIPFVRYSYAGLLSTYQWTNFDDDSQYNPSSIAAGIGYKGFLVLSNRKHFIYYGAFGEFIHEKGLHNMNSDDEYRQTRLAAAIYGNMGYRWNFNRNFYLNLGIMPGFAFDVKNEGIYNTGASDGLTYDDFKKNQFIGVVDFSFGWYLKRGY